MSEVSASDLEKTLCAEDLIKVIIRMNSEAADALRFYVCDEPENDEYLSLVRCMALATEALEKWYWDGPVREAETLRRKSSSEAIGEEA